MQQAMKAGCLYFCAVFAIGFVLGVLRTVFVAPSLGETFAVAIELPVILSLAWVICRRLADRYAVKPRLADRLVMGGVAFFLLMLGELSISVLSGTRGLAGHLALYRQVAHLLGLAGQVLFGLFPVLQVMGHLKHAASRGDSC